MIKKIAVLAVFIFSYASVVPLKAEKNEIVDARIAAETDAEAHVKADMKFDTDTYKQVFCCIGDGTLVAISAIGCAYLGCLLGKTLDDPFPSSYYDPPVSGCPISAGMVVGCLAGWGIGFAGSVYGIYKWGGRVPSERLLGKSPEYIEVYTATYKREIRMQRAIRAAGGSAILQGLLLLWAQNNL